MSRRLLHVSKLDAFKEWLTENGIQHSQGRGHYEVLRVFRDGKLMCVYRRNYMPEHYTTDRRLTSLVHQFCKEVG